ncbi:S1 family peptidase [Streptomyces sp. DSM 41987]|uniref:S1 family peptidase n=1 Tax=Streptomyces TaxID=1883 RepID=UPI00361580AB
MIQLEVLELSHRHVNKRTGAITGAVAAVVAGVAILLPHANASTNTPQPPETFSSQSAAMLAASLDTDLGGRTAGWYLDTPTSHLVVNVLSNDDARRVQSQGAIAKVVRNTMPALRDGVRTLSDTASIPGTAWSIDPKTNQIVVLADRTVTGTKMATLTRATDRLAGLVSVKRTSGEFTLYDAGGRRQGSAGGNPPAAGGGSPAAGGAGGQAGGANTATGAIGGSAIFGGRAQCSLGFNVTVQGAPAFITAGHCGNESKTWAADQAGSQPLGTVADSRFPKTDFALVTYDDPTTKPSSAVDLHNGSTQQITQAVDAAVGMKVQRSGSRTGLKDGTVTGLNATVNYGNGDIVNGLIQTDVCAEPGDSGGPMFAGDAAVGLTSGGSGDCQQGGETFFQPVTAALAATGAVIGAGDAGGSGSAAGGGGDANGNAAGGDNANGNDASAGSSAGAGTGDANGTDAGAGSGDANGTDPGAGAGAGDANGTDTGAGSTTGATTGADGGDGQQ